MKYWLQNGRKSYIPSFFQNSCQGITAIQKLSSGDSNVNKPGLSVEIRRPMHETKNDGRTVVGGFTCCVPRCFSNSHRNPDLSFYSIPNGKSKQKQELRKKWLHMISRKDFKDPGSGHRVCSKHFEGGCKPT